MPIKISKYLDPVPSHAISPSANGGYIPPPKGSGDSISSEELRRAKKRIILTRLLDDGLQTLGQMQMLEKDGVTPLLKMTTVELPYRNNQNGISAIPTGKYLVRSYYTEKYKQCFWVYSNEASNWQKNSIVGNGYKRTAVLIHRAPNSSWLMGCIGPAFKFNNEELGKFRLNKTKYDPNHLSGAEKGNPVGTGDKSFNGTNRLFGALNIDSNAPVTDTSFYMTIQNNPNGLLTGKNNANKIINKRTGEPIFMGESTT